MKTIDYIFSKSTEEQINEYCKENLLHKDKKYYVEAFFNLLFDLVFLAAILLWICVAGPGIFRFLVGIDKKWWIIDTLPEIMCATIFITLAGCIIILRMGGEFGEFLFPLHEKYKKEKNVIYILSSFSKYFAFQEKIKGKEIVETLVTEKRLEVKYVQSMGLLAKVEIDLADHYKDTILNEVIDFTWIDAEINQILEKNNLPLIEESLQMCET